MKNTKWTKEEEEYLRENYKKVSEKKQKYEEHRYLYTLWQKK